MHYQRLARRYLPTTVCIVIVVILICSLVLGKNLSSINKPESFGKPTLPGKKSHVPAHEVLNLKSTAMLDGLTQKLQDAANTNREIIMPTIGSCVQDMAMNYIYSNIVRHHLSNVLFMGLDTGVCQDILKIDLPEKLNCFVHTEDAEAGDLSRWNSAGFMRKLSHKTMFALEVLKRGFTVLVSDIDIYFFDSPVPVIRKQCDESDCDVATMWNAHGAYNSGFTYVRPTARSIELYTEMYDLMLQTEKDDQHCMNRVLKKWQTINKEINIVVLSEVRFPSGAAFFENKHCPSPGRYKEAVVVHNNYLFLMEDKIMRFKDCSLWEFDGPDGYYSSTERKYLQFSEPVRGSEYSVKRMLLNGLAVAVLLNRTFILPTRRNWESYILIMSLYDDHTHLFYNATYGMIREGAFLMHHLVPARVKRSLSAVYDLSCTGPRQKMSPKSMSVFSIKETFTEKQDSVLLVKPASDTLLYSDYKSILGEDVVSIITGEYKTPFILYDIKKNKM